MTDAGDIGSVGTLQEMVLLPPKGLFDSNDFSSKWGEHRPKD